jgi:predicted TIM-barrel fold metal-dependent hydrolase
MDTSGVSHAVLVQPSLYGFDNSYLADCIRRHPNQFAAVGMIDVRAEDALPRLSYWVQERGIGGLRIAPLLLSEGDVLSHAGAGRIWERAAELHIPICLLLAPSHIGSARSLIQSCPQATVVIDHLGRPDRSVAEPDVAIQPLLELAEYANVYVKISALPVISREPYPHADTFALIEAVWKHFGARRMLWATDFPHILDQCGYARALDVVRSHLHFFTEHDREWILGRTALELWAFGNNGS